MMPSMTPKMTSASGGKVNLQFKDRGYKYVQTYHAGIIWSYLEESEMQKFKELWPWCLEPWFQSVGTSFPTMLRDSQSILRRGDVCCRSRPLADPVWWGRGHRLLVQESVPSSGFHHFLWRWLLLVVVMLGIEQGIQKEQLVRQQPSSLHQQEDLAVAIQILGLQQFWMSPDQYE